MPLYAKIIIVTNDDQLKNELLLELAQHDSTVSLASSLRDFQALVAAETYHLAIIDGRLRDVNLLDSLLVWQEATKVPIIMLLATINPLYRYSLYNKGVFLCLERNCATKEIGIIAENVIRFSQPDKNQNRLPSPLSHSTAHKESHWQLNRNAWHLEAPNGEIIPLTHGELQLLEMLAKAHPRTITRTDIFSLMGIEENKNGERAIESRIHRLRKKIAAADDRQIIMTAYGSGWLLKEPIAIH